MKENKELLDELHITVRHYCEGEGIDFCESITLEQFKKIEDIVGNFITEHLTLDHSIEIFLQTSKQHRESSIQGVMFADCCCRKIAENIVDGIEMTDEECDKLQDEADNMGDEEKNTDTEEKAVRELLFWKHHLSLKDASFSIMLYNLIAKADGDNQQKLKQGFPEHWKVYKEWILSEDLGKALFKRYGLE